MIPFSPPHIDQLIIDEVVDTLKSGWITTGPKTKRFEKELAAYCGNPKTLCINSATAGLEIMLRWFGVTEGDEVILPAYTYSATANVIMHCGAKPVFVDIGDDFNISSAAVQKAITPKTKVIMPVDFAGYPCNYHELHTIIENPEVRALFTPATDEQKQLGRILILSDAAHSFGSRYQNKVAGMFTDVTVFSFHAVKNLTTAEGGAIAFNLPAPFSNDEMYAKLCVTTLHGQNKDALAKTQPGNWRYDIVEAGYKMNMTDIMASIGLVELSRYDSMVLPKRKHIFDSYSRALEKYDWAHLPRYETTDQTSSFHVYALRIRNCTEAQRDAIIARIFEKQVSVNVHFIPLPMMSFYKQQGFDIRDYPNTYAHYANEISLPVYFDLTDEQITLVTEAVIRSVDEVLKS
ncbi:MAG: DegT/DnrJ/EryC1/StrS family aminotransferase [Bacteroidota bacterium]